MRQDMKFLIFKTRPHGGRGYYSGKLVPYSRARLKAMNAENIPSRLPFGKKRNCVYQLNSYPIRRFLQSNVGRLWDEVYSEICEQTDLRSFQGWQLRKLVGYFVRFEGEQIHYWRQYDFFVDDAGILQRIEKVIYSKPVVPLMILGSKENQEWYEKLSRYDHKDNEIENTGTWFLMEGHYVLEYRPFRGYVRVRKGKKIKQLNSKELRRLGIENDREKVELKNG